MGMKGRWSIHGWDETWMEWSNIDGMVVQHGWNETWTTVRFYLWTLSFLHISCDCCLVAINSTMESTSCSVLAASSPKSLR